MKCNCYEVAFAPIILLLEHADEMMYFATPEYDLNRQRIHDLVQSLNLNFRCIDKCWAKELIE